MEFLRRPLLHQDRDSIVRLSGWQRIAAVLSVVWAAAAAVYQRNADVDRANEMAKGHFEACATLQDARPTPDIGICTTQYVSDVPTWLKGSWGNVALVALTPIPFGWLFVYLIIRVGRWVRAGFRQ